MKYIKTGEEREIGSVVVSKSGNRGVEDKQDSVKTETLS